MQDPGERGKHMQVGLVVVSFRQSTEDPYGDGSDDERTADGLEEDGVLDLAKSWLLDPHLTIEDLADEVTLFVFGDPRLIFIAVGTSECIERSFA